MPGLTDNGPASARLLIERGNSHEKGTYIPLEQTRLLIGRPTSSFIPEISLDNFLISRKHCRIEQCDGVWMISDLGSKHGTTLNGQPIGAHLAHVLNHGDKIGLASDVAVFRVVISREYEKTMEFERTQPTGTVNDPPADSPVMVDLGKMRLAVDHEVIALSAKEWLLLEALYKRRNKFVSYDEIRQSVWTERQAPDHGLPDVGVEEINVLVYRLRRKLGAHSGLVRTVRGRGCIFEP
ncbi:MAG: winged helix-turn-helix domain-containing protein [Negativicutes bacterium]|nr:winged helix-turn-helix domain-containing protein [Negativicutes bacterium]